MATEWSITTAATPISGFGCDWPMADICRSEIPIDPSITLWCQQLAAGILWAASGRRFGVCTSTVRPCTSACWSPGVSPLWIRAHTPFSPWSALAMCDCGDSCACTSVQKLVLPGRVQSITSVVIDGVTLDPSAYRQSGKRLYRVDGNGWPTCQDWNVGPGVVGSWEVTYRHGEPVPSGGEVAGGIYACQIAKACTPGSECELPERVATITRQNVSMTMLDPMTFLDEGRTGLTIPDMWLASVNPNKHRHRPVVIRADARKRHRLV